MDKLRTAFIAGALVTLTSASALAVTIDLGDKNTPKGPSISVNSSGFSFTISAKTVDDSGADLGTGAEVVQYLGAGPNDGGLGVISKPFDSNTYMDGGNSNLNDLLLLTFSTAVRIVGISFAGVDSDYGPDVAHFTLDGADNGAAFLDTSAFPSFLSVNWVGTSFGISALGTTDEFLVRAIQVTPVPIPAAGLLFASGLAGITALGLRKSPKQRIKV